MNDTENGRWFIFDAYVESRMTNLPAERIWSSLWATRSSAADVRLRFERGGEQFDNIVEQVPRFLQAHSRASTVADALFRDGCVGVVAWDGRKPYPAGLPRRTIDGFVALRSTGFAVPQATDWRAPLYPDPSDDEADVWTLRSYDLGRNKVARDTLLWHAVAAEMPIYPSAPVAVFLIDPETPLMLHVYDDRGMDVIGNAPAKLKKLYSRFADWLLDYDRERMAKLF